MQVGNVVYHYKNINVRYNSLERRLALKIPSKGITYIKREGIIYKILEDGEHLSDEEISFYCGHNRLIRKSFESHNSRKGIRVIIFFANNKSYRYGIYGEHLWGKKSTKSLNGYLKILPNSVSFIKDLI